MSCEKKGNGGDGSVFCFSVFFPRGGNLEETSSTRCGGHVFCVCYMCIVTLCEN